MTTKRGSLRPKQINRKIDRFRIKITQIEQIEKNEELEQKEQHQKMIKAKAESFEKTLSSFLHVFVLICKCDDEWRRSVYKRQVEYSTAQETKVKGLYAIWFTYTGMFEERAKYLERHGAKIKNFLPDMIERKKSAEKILRSWEKPVPSLAPSFRPVKISDEAARQLEEMFPDLLH